MTCEPLAGWRHVAVTERRTMEDFAHQMRWLADAAYPEAEKVRVVLDNLNTHRAASLYETFEPKEARRVIQRLEFHYTPKHGSWLNMAEIEFSVFSNQCLNRRIEDEDAPQTRNCRLGDRTKSGCGNHQLEVLHHRRSEQASAYLSVGFRLTRY